MTDREKLKQIILELSYEKRLVKLASGRESDFYFDGKQTTLHAEGGFLTGKLFYEAIRDVAGVQGVGGITLGADPIATARHQGHASFDFHDWFLWFESLVRCHSGIRSQLKAPWGTRCCPCSCNIQSIQ